MRAADRGFLLALGCVLAHGAVAHAQSDSSAATGSAAAASDDGESTPLEPTSPTPGTESTSTGNSTGTAATGATAEPTPAPSAAPAPRTPAGNRAAAQTPPDEDRRFDILFVQAEGGLSYTDLTALSSQGRLIPGLTEYRGAGYGGGLTVGFRYSLLALAAHGYVARFTGDGIDGGASAPAAFDLGQLMLEAQLRIPLPVIEPYLRAGFGYAWMGNFHIDPMYQDSTGAVNGYTGKLGLGVDVWLGTMFTFGAGADLSVMNLRRGGVQRADSACPSSNPTCVELREDGDAVGTLVHLHAQLALHL